MPALLQLIAQRCSDNNAEQVLNTPKAAKATKEHKAGKGSKGTK